MADPPDKLSVPEALAEVFDKPNPRLELSGKLLWNEHTEKLEGAEVDFKVGNLKDSDEGTDLAAGPR